MPSRRAVLATAAVGLAGCSSIADPKPVIPGAATAKRIDATVDGEWRTVARCEPADGYAFDHEDAPVDVPLAVSRGPAAQGGAAPYPDLPETGPLVVDRQTLDDLDDEYEVLRWGLSLTILEEDAIHGREAGTKTLYWISWGSFNRVAVGDRVTFRPSEDDERGVESIANVASARSGRN